jgi:hypothetical protein
MYNLILLKLSNLFHRKFMEKNMLLHQFVIFVTKFRYYCNYHVVIWRKKFELCPLVDSVFYLSLRHVLE